MSKTVGGATTKYLYDGANIVQEQDSANVATANLLTGFEIDQVFLRTDSAGARSFLTDILGSTIGLADAAGTITTSYTYEPFGTATSVGASSTNSFQFTGRENDGGTSLFFYRARYYSPTSGRFIAEDPLGFPGGPDVNLYAYVGNNPISLTDSSGLDPGNGCGFGCAFLTGLAGLLTVASIFATMVSIFIPASAIISLIAIGGAALTLAIAVGMGAPMSRLVTPATQLAISTAWALAAPVLVAAGAPSLLILGIALLVYAATVSVNFPPAPEPGR